MIGRVIGGRYEIIEKLGEGGMANVYKAKCNILKRFISIKILKQELSEDEEFVCKFKDEATEVAKLSNNNIVSVYDVGTENNIHYIVMEYIDGRTLKEYIKNNEVLSVKTALDFSIQICNALLVAHDIDLIHRDVKSQNILVSNNGLIKVTDFGIAKSPDSATITNSGKILGSAYYISPEQAKGGFIDCRTDIYSLGVVMYEMFTGKLPFTQGTPVNVALQHIQVDPIEPVSLNNKIPLGVNNLIIRCLQKNVNLRYQSIAELRDDLIQLQSNKKYVVSKVNLCDSTMVMKPLKGSSINSGSSKYTKKSKSKIKILIFSLGIVLFLSIVLIFISILGYPLSINSKVNVPDIIGKSMIQIESELRELGINVEVSGSIESDYEKDIVVDMYPKKGTQIRKGDTVKVVLSAGVEKVIVPDFTGQKLDDIKIELQKRSLNIGNIEERFSEVYESGKIIVQNPISNSSVEKNSEIDFIISKGSETKLVLTPNFVGLSLVEAQNLASLNGILVEFKSVKTDNIENKDKIFYQSIPNNIEIKAHVVVVLSYYEYEPKKEEIIPEEETEENVDSDTTLEGEDVNQDIVENEEVDESKNDDDVEKYLVKQVLIPKITDITIKDAKVILEKIGIKLDYTGFKDGDLIKEINKNEGESVSIGTVIKVTSTY